MSIGIEISPLRASNLNRAWRCPPAPWREAEMPEEAGEHAARDEGALLHWHVERDGSFEAATKQPRLTPEQERVVGDCVKFGDDILNEFTGGYGAELYQEKQLLVPGLGRKCKADWLLLVQSQAVVIDWKMGRAIPEIDASRDLQLWAYALGARYVAWSRSKLWLDKVTVYRFHPRLWDENRCTSAVFEGEFGKYEATLRQIVERSQPEAAAEPGPMQCQYCKAKVACPEFEAWTSEGTTALVAINEALPASRLGEVLQWGEQLKAANAVMKAAKAHAIAALEAGVEITSPDGTRWELKEGVTKRSIPDALEARKVLAHLLPQEAIDSCASLRVTDLQTAFKAATGLKGKAASIEFEAALGDLLVRKQNAPTVVAMKETGEKELRK